jgi:hypothetical protein
MYSCPKLVISLRNRSGFYFKTTENETSVKMVCEAFWAPGRRSRCLAVLDVAQATPPGAKAPAALPKNQIYPLATDTLFSGLTVLRLVTDGIFRPESDPGKPKQGSLLSL